MSNVIQHLSRLVVLTAWCLMEAQSKLAICFYTRVFLHCCSYPTLLTTLTDLFMYLLVFFQKRTGKVLNGQWRHLQGKILAFFWRKCLALFETEWMAGNVDCRRCTLYAGILGMSHISVPGSGWTNKKKLLPLLGERNVQWNKSTLWYTDKNKCIEL